MFKRGLGLRDKVLLALGFSKLDEFDVFLQTSVNVAVTRYRLFKMRALS